MYLDPLSTNSVPDVFTKPVDAGGGTLVVGVEGVVVGVTEVAVGGAEVVGRTEEVPWMH